MSCAVASAQDLAPRRAFRVEITTPDSGEIVSGKTKIEASVTAPRLQDIDRVEFFVDDELVFVDRDEPWQFVHDFGNAAGVHVVRVIAHHRDGPTVSDFVITRLLDIKYVVNVERVVMDVSVRDKKRRLVAGLGKDEFAVSENGRPQNVLSVSPEERPLLVGLVIDSSGSMRGRIEEAQKAACRFAETLRDEDRLFVIDFDEAVYLIEPVTSDREAACGAIRTTEAVGGTALYDALHAAYGVLYEASSERRALVVLSDGDDTESRITLEELTAETMLNDVIVYAIGLDVAALSTARRALNRLSEDTGGRAFFVRKASDLETTYEAIAEELRTLYQLVYASDNQRFEGQFIEVRVELPERKDYDVSHRKGYHAVAREERSSQ